MSIKSLKNDKLDILFIKQLTVFATIGVHEWEQRVQQKLVLDIEIESNNCKAAAHDDIKYALNYVEISEVVLKYLQEKHFALIERVAEEIADLLIKKFQIFRVVITVGKPGAVSQAKMVGVQIERKNSTK